MILSKQQCYTVGEILGWIHGIDSRNIETEEVEISNIDFEAYALDAEKKNSGIAKLVTDNLNTDFTAGRMLGYLAHYDHLPEVEIADEMLAILSDRKQIMDKKAAEGYNAAWNEDRQAGLFDNKE